MKLGLWLNFYGWPAAALIIFFCLLGWLFVLLHKQTAPRAALPGPPAVRYAPRGHPAAVAAEETAEVRALYASDLFASARDNRFAAALPATNRSVRAARPPFASPAFLLLPPELDPAPAAPDYAARRVLDSNDLDAPAARRLPKTAAGTSNRTPVVSIVCQGDLKNSSIAPDILQGLTLPGKAWSVRAEVYVNHAGQIEHVLAEPQACDPALYQAIIKRLYQYRFTNATRSCRGEIIINSSRPSKTTMFSSGNDTPAPLTTVSE